MNRDAGLPFVNGSKVRARALVARDMFGMRNSNSALVVEDRAHVFNLNEVLKFNKLSR